MIAARFYFLVAVIRLTYSLSFTVLVVAVLFFVSQSLDHFESVGFYEKCFAPRLFAMLNAMKLDAMARVKIKLILSSRHLISLMKANDSIYYG